MPRKKDETKMTLTQKLEHFCRVGEKFKLKTLEVAENSFKIEFSDVGSTKRARKLTKAQQNTLNEEKTREIMDDLQLTDPEAYEELLLVKPGGLKELS